MRDQLLGKWRSEDDYRKARGFYLRVHIEEVLRGMHFLFTEPFHGYKKQASMAMALHTVMGLEVPFLSFQKLAFLSALAHDLGKSGPEFQEMLWGMEEAFRKEASKQKEYGVFRKKYTNQESAEKMRTSLRGVQRHSQMYRHEFLSALLLWHHPEIRSWFESEAGTEENLALVLSAAFGHHLKADASRAIKDKPSHLTQIVELSKLSADLQHVCSLPLCWQPASPFPSLGDWTHEMLASPKSLGEALSDLSNELAFRPGSNEKSDTQMSAALKWLVILADTLGSMDSTTAETEIDARNRIEDELRRLFVARTVDYQARIARRVDLSDLKPWQSRARTRKNMICTAGTGQGKTVTALNWAAASPSLRLMFCGVTTDAVTLLCDQYGLEDDYLRHSRAWLDAVYTPTPEDDPKDSKEEAEEARRLMSNFRGFNADITFTTADAVLGLMSFYRSSIMWLPYLLKAQIVFDEVESFDPIMRGWYFQFLSWFPGLRTAHLSATIPNALLSRMKDNIRQENPRRGDKTEPRLIQDPGQWATDNSGKRVVSPRAQPRFRIHVVDRMEAANHFSSASIWYLNTVERCQNAGREFADAIVYHSRFQLKARRAVRQKLERAFKGGAQERVVSTQAAEMSLDISAQTLISEIAPLSSLIQRLGRCNRRGEFGVVDVYFYMPEPEAEEQDKWCGLPYIAGKEWKKSFQQWADWLVQFKGKEVSQGDLEAAFQEYYSKHPEALTPTKRVRTSLLRTSRLSVRQHIPTQAVLLESDYHKGMKLRDAVLASVPVILSDDDEHKLKEADSIDPLSKMYILGSSFGSYDSRLGFIARKKVTT